MTLGFKADRTAANAVVRRVGPADLAAWDAFVAEHPKGLIYHTSAWKSALEGAFPHIKGEIFALVDPEFNAIRSGLPLYSVDSWLFGSRKVSIPFATISEPLVETVSDLGELLKYAHPTGERRRRSLEIRGVRDQSLMDGCGFSSAGAHKHHYIELTDGPESILYRFSRTAIRRMISKAVKEGIIVSRESSLPALETFYDLFVLSRRRLKLPPIPFRFFKALHKSLGSESLSIFVARKGPDSYGAALGLRYKGDFFLEYSGERPDVNKTGVNQLLYWSAIQSACEEGCERFSFGRTNPQNKGLIEYKRHWGTVEEDIPTYAEQSPKVALSRDEDSFSYRLGRQVAGSIPMRFFPLMGEFCFSHWG
jgi:hypothetical protein